MYSSRDTESCTREATANEKYYGLKRCDAYRFNVSLLIESSSDLPSSIFLSHVTFIFDSSDSARLIPVGFLKTICYQRRDRCCTYYNVSLYDKLRSNLAIIIVIIIKKFRV